MTEAPRKRALLPKLLLAAAIALVAVEVSLRVVDARAGRGSAFFLPPPEGGGMFAPHPYIGFVLRPGVHALDRSRSGIHVNSLGMRGPEWTVEKPAGTFRILCLGGSTTYCTAILDDGKTWPARLEDLLNEQSDGSLRYEVGNCGVPAYTTAESLINFALRGVELDPDAILIYHAANDSREIQAEGFLPDYSHLRRAWVSREISPFERFLLGNVRIYAWLARGLDPEAQDNSLSGRIFRPDFQGRIVQEPVHSAGVEIFIRNIDHIVRIARARGIVPILCTFATDSRGKLPEGQGSIPAVQAMNARLIDYARAESLPLIDVAAKLSDRHELFDDWMHRNADGAQAHARAVMVEAKRQGLFER